jgi:hypothetical protein
MLSFEAASKTTDLYNLVFIGGLLTIIVFGALGAYVAYVTNKRSRWERSPPLVPSEGSDVARSSTPWKR